MIFYYNDDNVLFIERREVKDKDIDKYLDIVL